MYPTGCEKGTKDSHDSHDAKSLREEPSVFDLLVIYKIEAEKENDGSLSDDILKLIFFNESICFVILISLKIIPTCEINNKPILLQIMAWRWFNNEPLSDTMMTYFTYAYA